MPLHASGSGISILAEIDDSTIEEYLEDLSDTQMGRRDTAGRGDETARLSSV